MGKRPKLILLSILSVFLCTLAGMYGVALWYKTSHASRPVVLGASFIPSYAESLGLNAQQTMDALINDADVRHFRLVSYWNQLETSPGEYDFTSLDWQFAKAEKAGATITLSVGLRQPRWPECHMPQWAADKPKSYWQPRLETFMTTLVDRYKHSPALHSYQLENEFFISDFGTCKDFDRSRLVREFDLVKRHDNAHPVIISRSNNLAGWPASVPAADTYAISIYRRVWNTRLFHSYIDYPVPAWYYSFIAGWQKLVTGRETIIHELQTEPWPPDRQSITETSREELDKSFTADDISKRIVFARATGIHDIYLWGSEYWYYRKVKLHDPSVWDATKEAFAD